MKTPLALLLIVLSTLPAYAEPRTQPTLDPRALLHALEEAFTTVADRVTPAVVNVSTVPRKQSAEETPERFREFFGEEFYERFFRRRPREDTRASGSGVTVDPRGYILTNNHVIENAQDITVRLSDGRKFTAKLVGRDPKTDLAVLKVEAPSPLPAAELGDSDHLRVGQWAIAIGNPFGLDRTVTVGIISATARNRVGVATYENFIQTDASINPGNSGGPLLNLDGKVIGINTAIVAAGQGIGFSIPINQAKEVMRQLIASGRVVRGWLGIAIQDVTDELAGTFGVKEGVLVAEVMKGGPAEAAGVRQGDVIVELNGAPIKEVPELQRRVAAVAPGQPVRLKVIRERKPVALSVTVTEMPAEEPVLAGAPDEESWGLGVEPLSGEAAAQLGLTIAGGLLVTDVVTGGPADRAGLRRGDVIVEVGKKPVADPAALFRMLAQLKPGDRVLVFVQRPSSGGRGAQARRLRLPHQALRRGRHPAARPARAGEAGARARGAVSALRPGGQRSRAGVGSRLREPRRAPPGDGQDLPADHADRRHAHDRAHHGRERHRQGARRARDPHPQRPTRPAVRRRERRRHPRHADRVGALRPREGRVHRRPRPQAREVRARPRRDGVPRRDRLAAPGPPDEAPPRPPGARDRAPRRAAARRDRRARRRRDQRQPQDRGADARVP